jgi:mono/diheme cytochrome c family protein
MKLKIVIGLLLLAVAALSVGAFMMHYMMQHGFSAGAEPMPLEKARATAIRCGAIPSRYRTTKNPVGATPEVIHDGMAHWADHCSSCHANNGSGDTMYGRTMYPRPPDMRRKDTQEMSDGELYFTIKNGVRLSGMPAFGEPCDDDLDSWKLVVFIRHLPSLSRSEELEMEKLNPKSPGELEEEQQEEEFLGGTTPSSSTPRRMREPVSPRRVPI